MSRPTWDEVWLSLTDLMATRSRCPSGAGAVIVDPQQRVVSTGYAGPPAGYQLPAAPAPDTSCIVYCQRAMKQDHQKDPAYLDCPSAHAEANAIASGDRSRMESGTIYVSSVPCWGCAKLISNCGVSRVVWQATDMDEYRPLQVVVEYLGQCGLQVDVI